MLRKVVTEEQAKGPDGRRVTSFMSAYLKSYFKGDKANENLDQFISTSTVLQVFFDLNETEKVPDDQVQDYFRLWIHHCIKIRESVEARKSQQNSDALNSAGHGGQSQLPTGQTVAVQQVPNHNFAMAARAMVNGQAPSTIPVGRLYSNEHPSGQFGHQNTVPSKSGPVGLGGQNSQIQRFPTPVNNISPVKLGNEMTVSKKRPSEEESDQEAKIIKHEVPEDTSKSPPMQIIQIVPPTQNAESHDPSVKSTVSQVCKSSQHSLSQENMNALSTAASNQIRRGFPPTLPPTHIQILPKPFSHFQNSSQANLQRAFSQVTQLNQKMPALRNNDIFDNAHQSPAISSIAQQTSTSGPEKRIFLHEKITLLQSTNDILTSGNFHIILKKDFRDYG